MNLLGRLLIVLVRGLVGVKLDPLGTSRVSFRTWFHDLDTNIHMNNGRFLQFMDLGRTDLMIRCGLLGPILRNGWRPVVANVAISYRKSLSPLQKFVVSTKILHWDEKWFFIEQEFHSQGKLCARALVRAVILHKQKSISPAEIVKIVAPGAMSQGLPADWQTAGQYFMGK